MSMPIKAFVFDLGGVLLNISYLKTIHAFQALGVPNPEAQFSKAQQSTLFEDFETGRISEAEWILSMRGLCNEKVSGNQIIEAWNAMLLDFPPQRYQALLNLKNDFPIYLLSNTNITHISHCRKEYKSPVNWHKFEDLFDQVFLSYEMGMRKPDQEIFREVETKIGCSGKEVWYIDDSPQHIKTAKSLNWNAVHLKEGEETLHILEETGLYQA